MREGVVPIELMDIHKDSPSFMIRRTEVDRLTKLLNDMQAEIERLREALTWYADEENHWRSHSDDMCMSEVDNDNGERAREALHPQEKVTK